MTNVIIKNDGRNALTEKYTAPAVDVDYLLKRAVLTVIVQNVIESYYPKTIMNVFSACVIHVCKT